MKLQAPSLGRVVHYLAPRTNKPVMAAIIIAVKNEHPDQITEGLVDLNVLHPNSGGGHLVPGVKFSRKEKEGHWFWPAKVEEIEVTDQGIAFEKAEKVEMSKPEYKQEYKSKK